MVVVVLFLPVSFHGVEIPYCEDKVSICIIEEKIPHIKEKSIYELIPPAGLNTITETITGGFVQKY